MSGPVRARSLALIAALALIVPTALVVLAGPAFGATPSLRIADLSATETNSLLTKTVTITRAAPTTTRVTVRVRSVVGTASAADFTAVPLTTVTFLPGQTTRAVTVRIAGDLLDEANEYFSLLLSSPVGATIADGSGRVTIVDNDATPVVGVPAQELLEGSAGLANVPVNVTLSAPSGQVVTVAWSTLSGTAISGDDFEPGSGTVTFPLGTTTRQLLISVDGDGVDEVNERFYLQLSAPSHATVASAYPRLSLLDDDSPNSPQLFAVNPATGPSHFITLKGAAASGSLVQFFNSANCTGGVGFQKTAQELAAGIPLTAADNAVSSYSARTVNGAMEVSACSNSVSYTHDDLAPNAPTIDGFNVTSPANNNLPKLGGVTETGVTVRIFKDACVSSPVATGSPNTFATTGITFPVIDDTTNTMYVDAVDAAGNRSVCVPAGTYVEDSTTPAPLPFVSIVDSGVGTQPLVQGDAEAGSMIDFYAPPAGPEPCGQLVKSVTADALSAGARIPFDARTQSIRYFSVRDQAGNATPCDFLSTATYTEQSTEIEPNDSIANTSAGSSGAGTFHQFGEIGAKTDNDYYSVVVPAGAAIYGETFDVLNGPTCASNLLDSQLSIFDSAGNQLVTNDDSGAGFCSLASQPNLAAGTYYVVVGASSFANNLDYPVSYDVRITVLVPTVVAEVEANNTAATANAIGAFDPTTPRDATGAVSVSGDVDFFSFTMSAGKPVTIETFDGSTSTCVSNVEDTRIQLFAADGTTLLAQDDDAGAGFCSKLTYTAVSPGTYFVRLSSSTTSPTQTFNYRLGLR